MELVADAIESGSGKRAMDASTGGAGMTPVLQGADGKVQCNLSLFDNIPLMVTASGGSYGVQNVNKAWKDLCGWKEEAEWKNINLKVLQKEGVTCRDSVNDMNNSLERLRPTCARVINFNKFKRPFLNEVEVLPVVQNGRVVGFLGSQNEIDGEVGNMQKWTQWGGSRLPRNTALFLATLSGPLLEENCHYYRHVLQSPPQLHVPMDTVGVETGEDSILTVQNKLRQSCAEHHFRLEVNRDDGEMRIFPLRIFPLGEYATCAAVLRPFYTSASQTPLISLAVANGSFSWEGFKHFTALLRDTFLSNQASASMSGALPQTIVSLA